MKLPSKHTHQNHFSHDQFKSIRESGGSLHGKGNAKSARALSAKKAMHVVLRSTLATGDWSLRSAKNIKMVETTLRTLAKTYGIKIRQRWESSSPVDQIKQSLYLRSLHAGFRWHHCDESYWGQKTK